MTNILGIDPGSRITGFGVIALESKKISYITSGCIRLEKQALPQRLLEIFNNINELIQAFQPTEFAIEKVFISKNVDSALKLGQARGAAMVAAAQNHLNIFEYSPNEVKQAIVGKGHADKTQVQHMIKILLNLPISPQSDAADALAIALCHAHLLQSKQNLIRNLKP
jgi:crossover junction endodeoxyribonuclease RuvC